MPEESSAPRSAWEYLAGLLGTHRYRPDSDRRSQAAPYDLRGEYRGEVSAAGHIAAVQGTFGSGLPDRFARRGDVRLPARRADRPAGRIAGPGRLAGPHVSQRAGYAGHPTACPAVRLDTGSRRYPRPYKCRTPSGACPDTIGWHAARVQLKRRSRGSQGLARRAKPQLRAACLSRIRWLGGISRRA